MNYRNPETLTSNNDRATVRKSQNFLRTYDASILKNALEGFSVKTDAIIDTICNRTNEERQVIKKSYATIHERDLMKDVMSKTRGDFKDVLVALLTPKVDYLCNELYDAITGFSTNIDIVVEILFLLPNKQIQEIKQKYQKLYKKSIEDNIPEDIKEIFQVLFSATRNENDDMDIDSAKLEAKKLQRSLKLTGQDLISFVEIFAQNNFDQLKLIIETFEDTYKIPLTQILQKVTDGNVKTLLDSFVNCTINSPEYFAKKLHKSMVGLGTNDKDLMRLIVTRCEYDMSDIKVAFLKLYGQTLKEWIMDDTSGDFRKTLLALIEEPCFD